MKPDIWSALYELLNETNSFFKDIRIKDICKKGEFHRSTFYRHFKDKYDLLEYGLGILWKDYFDTEKKSRMTIPFQTATEFYEYSKGRELFSKQLNDEVFNEAATAFLVKQMTADILNELEVTANNKLPKTLLADFLVETIMTIDNWNKRQNTSITPEKLDDYYKQLVSGSLGEDFW